MAGKEKIKCYECGSKNTIKKGKRKSKYEIVQKYFCDDCKKYYYRIRDKAIELFSPEEVIFKKVFYHQQPYKFQYHKAKVELFINEYFIRSKNYACKLAKLALSTAKNNMERHTAIEKFMLCNDTCTVAVEVPVYVYLDEIKDYGILGLFKIPINEKRINETTIKNNNTITGHIDFRFCNVPKDRIKEFFVRNKARKYFTSKEFQNIKQKVEVTKIA